MSEKTGISWTTSTWNPVTGCDKVSPGCKNCYAETFAERWRGIKGHPYEQGFDLKLWPVRLSDPLRWKKPRRIFVNSMSDLFHEKVPFEFIGQVWDTMFDSPRHIYQILTKRPERALEFVQYMKRAWRRTDYDNVWMGVSIENADYAFRADILRQIPAKVRFISYEPALGPLADSINLHGIHWVIYGGESGKGFRKEDKQWARDMRDKCRRENVAFFHKQSSGPRNETGIELDGEIIHEFPK